MTYPDKASGKTYYRKRLLPGEGGLTVITERWVSIHETPCFDYCILDFRLFGGERTINHLKCRAKVFREDSLLKAAKRFYKVKRIAKQHSRFAFETEEKALENLRYLKRLQLRHIKRDAVFIETFLDCDQLAPIEGTNKAVVPDTVDLVCTYFVFD